MATTSDTSGDALPARAGHKAFSLGRIWTIATSTLTQLARMKVFYFLVVFVILLCIAGFLFIELSYEQELKILKDVAFGSMSLFSIILAIVGTAILIPRDVEDRTLYTILSKPVPRYEYLIGKLLGVLLLIGISLLVMDAIFTGILYLRQNMLIAEQISFLQADGATEADIASVRALVEEHGARWGLQGAVFSIFLKAAVLASLSLLLSTFATSTLFTIVVGFAVFFIGHGQGLARDYFLKGAFTGPIEKLVTVALAIVFPDLQLFSLVDGVVSGDDIPGGVLLKVTGIAALYIVIYNLAAHFVFAEKEL